MSMTEDNIVVLFKRFEDLKRDEDLILREYAEEWAESYVAFDVMQAAIGGDRTCPRQIRQRGSHAGEG